MRKPVAAIVLSLAAVLGASTALADDWTAVRLRGGVFALENGAWTQLVRGSVVSDDRVIKSAPGGRITLVRGAETIELGPETTAQISDRSGFTTVYNHEGTVGIDAEARNVQHFAVQTHFLAAVVKGTAFTVQSSPTASTVTVARGSVEVDDEQNGSTVSVSSGQQVSSSQGAPITSDSVVVAPPNAPKPPAPAENQPPVTQFSQAADQVIDGQRASGTVDSSTNGAFGGGNGNGNSGNGNGNGNGGGNGNGNSGNGNGNGNGGGNGNGNSGNGNGNGNGGGNGNGNSGNGNGNGGGNGNGNSGNGNGNGGGNGNGNSGNGNGNGNGGGNGKGKGKD
ncbi:MAG TPA: FecR domain-containing protein [Devosiaceae bacterium]|nr:FecR domain-containing protein [Devosiaceae bacterium]